MNLFNRLHDRLSRHLRENNQGYFEHACDAWGYAGKSALASVSFFIHGIFPFTFEHTGSSHVNNIHQDIKAKMERMQTKPT